MTYSLIEPPFNLQFRDMAKKDLVAYAAWFHNSAPERIGVLTKAVNCTSGYENWESNATPESLDELGQWFEGQAETRKRGREEVENIRSKLMIPVDIPDEELADRTLSLAMDISMYFARVVLKNLPGTYWDQPLKNKKFVDYGHPVIMGFGAVPLNPVRVIITNAYKAAGKQRVDLRRLYDTWARMKR